jgi:protein-L-isoaspartate(D-aspartate) O-methyltransferase
VIDATRRARLSMALRQSGVTDTRVLTAIELVPRDLFVPKPFADRAWDDIALPLAMGQTISQPLVVALMTEALELTSLMRVLEIGTGSGYQSAVLAGLCRRVYSIERHPVLLKGAEARFRELGIHNITAITGDGTLGWPKQAPFDRILVTAAAPRIPDTLVEQLGEGGAMVLPVGPESVAQHVVRVRKRGGRIETEDLFPVRFVPLVPGRAD